MTDTQSFHSGRRKFGGMVMGFWSTAGASARTALAIGAGAGCLLFATGANKFSFPQLPHIDGTILSQPSPIVDLIVIAVMLALSTLIGTIVAGAVHFEAGLFSAAFGMLVLSLYCGTMQSVLFEANGSPGVYFRLLLELLILAAMLLGLWAAICRFSEPVALHPEKPAEAQTLLGNLTATLAQTVVTAIVIMFLCQSEAKNQCLASVGIASVIGSAAAFKYAPTRPSIWYWIGPIIVGVVGYFLAGCGQVGNLSIGIPTGTFAALARPLPLDYASVGVAGAILGYWMVQPNTEDEGQH